MTTIAHLCVRNKTNLINMLHSIQYRRNFRMKKANLVKFISLFFVVIAAQILLSMIEAQIQDRSSNRHYARSAVESSWTGDQTILAAVLVIPYERSEKIRVFDKEIKRYVEETKWNASKTYILPKTMNIKSKLAHQVLHKGIYDVPVYSAEINLNGAFETKKLKKLIKDPSIRLLKTAYLSFGVSDTRGLTGTPLIEIDKNRIEVLSGSNLDFFLHGFHGEFPLSRELEDFVFDVDMQVNGMGKIAYIATAEENDVNIASDWPHPSFSGAFLPTSRDISANGYTANWKNGMFSTDIENTMKQCFQGQCDYIYSSSFGVDHIDAVDIYLKSLRSVKYGLLVVIITFTIFILYEVLNKGVRIHPISYGLTGMALAIFFLLLIALSEHLSFSASYWISSLACSGLIGYYVRHLSQSIQHGGSIFAMLNGFYLVLFFIIRSEDHALLSGSVLLFVLLAVVMMITKKIDWYQMGNKQTVTKTE